MAHTTLQVASGMPMLYVAEPGGGPLAYTSRTGRCRLARTAREGVESRSRKSRLDPSRRSGWEAPLLLSSVLNIWFVPWMPTYHENRRSGVAPPASTPAL